MTAQTEVASRRRYGSTARVAGSVGVFGVLFMLGVYTIIDASYLMSNHCFDDTGQIVCPTSGPDWARPLPGAATLLGVLTGLAGIAVGRPVRTPALIAGFLLTAAALVAGRLLR